MDLRGMSRHSAVWVMVVGTGLWAGWADCHAAPRKDAKSSLGGKAVTDCFKDADMDLGVPPAAVFFLAEVSVEGEPMANRRWFVKSNGAVHFSDNAPPLDFAKLSKVPFNQPFGQRPIAILPSSELADFLAWLDAEGMFRLAAESGPPSGVTVQGGVDRWVVARHTGRTACIRLRPGAPLSETLKRRFGALVEAHMP